MYLKTHYGSGYHLTITKDVTGGYGHGKTYCSAHDVLDFLLNYTPNAKLLENIGTEMTFIIPMYGEMPGSLMTMILQSLEKHKRQLCIDKYGISFTTLEEVSNTQCGMFFI